GRAATAVTTKKRRKFRDSSVKLRLSTCPTRNSPGAAGAAAYAFAMAPSLDLAQPVWLRRDSVAARQCQRGPEPASQCGGSEVRIILAASPRCGLLNQSHTRFNKLLVPFDSEVRKRACRKMMRTSESGH